MGLTIIELLVITAVLSILVAILFPILFSVRKAAYRMKCASNLKQLYGAFCMYSDDWGSYWPCPGGLVGDRSYWAQSGNGGLFPYVKQRGIGSIWCCPAMTEWAGIYPARSYSMNSYLRTPCDVEYPSCVSFLKGININKIPLPTRTILLFEGIPRSGEYQNLAYTEDQIYYIYRCANWNWVRGAISKFNHTIEPGTPWHGKVNNYLYCDGHIVARKPTPYLGKLDSTYEEMYEWYVDKNKAASRLKTASQ